MKLQTRIRLWRFAFVFVWFCFYCISRSQIVLIRGQIIVKSTQVHGLRRPSIFGKKRKGKELNIIH